MSLRTLLGRWWAHRKLHRGRCQWCSKPLPDDYEQGTATFRACSPECTEELLELIR